MYAQNTSYEVVIPCTSYYDKEYYTGIGISKPYADKDTANAVLLAKLEALSCAVFDIATHIRGETRNATSPNEIETGYFLKDTFDLDDFQFVCLQTAHTKEGIVAYTAICLYKTIPVNRESNKIRNLIVVEITVEADAKIVDGDMNFISSELGLQIESVNERWEKLKSDMRIFLNPSAAKKFHEMAAQEDFDNTDRKIDE
jgi:hypothetical protein